MPLANKSCRETCLTQIPRKKNRPVWHWSLVVNDVVMVHVLTRQDRRTTGRTKRSSDKGVDAMGPLASQPIQMRRFEECRRLRVETHEIVSVVITENKDDVARKRGGGVCGHGTKTA
jgi:hypothetical protein